MQRMHIYTSYIHNTLRYMPYAFQTKMNTGFQVNLK